MAMPKTDIRQPKQRGGGLVRAMGFALIAAFLNGCYERKEAAVINPDGSGKITIQTDIAVAAEGRGGDRNADVLATGRLFAANLINSTRGVDAWGEVSVTVAADGRAHIAGTAYFPDVNKLRFDVPIEFAWKRDADGAVFTIQRTHSPTAAPAAHPTAEQVNGLVKQARDQHKVSQPVLQVQLGAFRQEMRIELPGDLSDEQVLSREGNAVSLTIDGKKVFQAIDAIMSNDTALAETFSTGVDGPANDDIMVQSMYGTKGPISVRAKFAPGAAALFDYKTEMRVAQIQESDMLKAAGVELIPKFTVRPAGTAPASGGGK